jgi:hypothetical protein
VDLPLLFVFALLDDFLLDDDLADFFDRTDRGDVIFAFAWGSMGMSNWNMGASSVML